MSVRVVARIRPLLQSEVEKDQILSIHSDPTNKLQAVKIPNPKNFAEEYSFQFNSVYGNESTQQEIFDAEVSPTLRQLFQGIDVTIFAYGVTGTGKTHTMRGGKSLVDRGMIPRILSNIYRKSKSLEKSSDGGTTVEVVMSYYEIYNDKVFDLFDAPEKRTATGLPIREAEGGKTVVVGLTEVSCCSLKEFETLYDRANSNRSVGATKLNAHSSRSHAILCVKVTVSTATETRSSTISAIDLAGSEDNRRTGNVKDRMVESASINKSLFVLAQCVEAISKKQQRIPYRESKMTRILSLGQNEGICLMVLNLAPTKSYHLDTLSSLNFANRTKRIEIREVENESIFKGPPRPIPSSLSSGGSTVQRQPLRPLTNAANMNLMVSRDGKVEKPAKSFAVYSDRTKPASVRPTTLKSSPLKRVAEPLVSHRPTKQRPNFSYSRREPETQTLTKATLESMVEKKVSEILAAREMNAPIPEPKKDISAEVQARLDQIERRLQGQEGERAEGLSYLFMAKQHQARGEDSSALRMYELAQPFFEGNEKLKKKIGKLRVRLAGKRLPDEGNERPCSRGTHSRRKLDRDENDESYHCDENESSAGHDTDDDLQRRVKKRAPRTQKKAVRNFSPDPLDEHQEDDTPELQPTPRTTYLVDILNSRDASRLKGLNGLGTKKAEAIVGHLNQQKENHANLRTWRDVLDLDVRGIGKRSWEVVRGGVLI